MKARAAPSKREFGKACALKADSEHSRGERDIFWSKVVKSWRTPPEALSWFQARGIEEVEAADAAWLRSKTADSKFLSNEKGGGESLYRAILSDARFAGDFSRFQLWMQPWRDFTRVVSSWQTPDDVIAWARSYELPARKLVDSRWLRKFPLLADRDEFKGLYSALLEDPRFTPKFSRFSSWFKQGSSDTAVVAGWRTKEDVLVWAAHNGVDVGCLLDETALRSRRRRIHRAILCDPRFQANFKNFKAWLDIATASSTVVSSWQDKRDAAQWAEFNGMSLADLGSPDTLTTKGLSAIVAGVLSDVRFQGDFAAFRRWLGFDLDCVALVRSWRTKEDALDWTASAGVSWEFLEGVAGPHEQNLEGVKRAILEDRRFEGSLSRFRAWIGLEPDFHSVVKKWNTPHDAISWARARGISESNLGRRAWLISTSGLPTSQGGIGECLEGLASAIASDPRFDGDFLKFNRWLGVTNWAAIVQSWKTPRDAHVWAAARPAIIDSARRSRKARGGGEFTALVQAIVKDTRFTGGLRSFLSWLEEL
jgi:hypothetical protein